MSGSSMGSQREHAHQAAWIFGAVRPGARYRGRACDHRGVRRGDAIAAQRDALALDPEAQVILLLDRAGWRRAKRLVSPANVTPLHLPPYSPELGIERVSFYLRERFLTHRGVDHAEATIDACCQAWNRLLAETGRLQTLAALPGLQRSILGKIGITPQ